MKYMHFKASCSYTTLAAIMEIKGIHTEDYEIALDIRLPWLFAKESDTYLSGPMLQGAKWFNLWLNPRGYTMIEKAVPQDQLCEYLRTHAPAMLGIQTPHGKHAVVFTEYNGAYHFLNPTYEGSGECTELSLCEEELLSLVEPTTIVGTVRSTEPKYHDIALLLRESLSVIHENCDEIIAFAAEKHDPDSYSLVMNRLFRPLLLDGITMLELAGESALAHQFAVLQQQFMSFIRGTREKALRETLPLDILRDCTEQYARLIEQQIGRECTEPSRETI